MRHQQSIQQANDFIKNTIPPEEDPFRLEYHLTPPTGWMNDPNGMVYFNGEYHVFYQFYPYKAEHAPCHWGHAKSTDLVHWERLSVALAPSENYDLGGCWSGSAVDHDGVMTVFYTGVDDETLSVPKQVVCMATSIDGIHFTKYSGNPVISEPPAEGSGHFRDPKVWQYENVWYMVVGTTKDDKGKVALYRSENLVDWDYVGIAAESDGSQGWMWECPDLFPIGDKHGLVVSPMGMNHEPNSKNICMIGSMNYETGKFTSESIHTIDYGQDFYAAQTLVDGDNRRILIGWMNMWNTAIPTKNYGWAGALTIPRELFVEESGTFRIAPVEELKMLRTEVKDLQALTIHPGCLTLDEVESACFEMEIEFDLTEVKAEKFGVLVRCSSDGTEETVISYQVASQLLQVDRSHSGEGEKVSCQATVPGAPSKLKLRLFVDRSSLEVWVEEGNLFLTNRIYPHSDSNRMKLFAEGGFVHMTSLKLWTLA